MVFPFDLDTRFEKRWQALADQSRTRLAAQQIAAGEPGTILKDVDVIIQFIGPEGIATRSRNAAFPAERLAELDAKVGHQIELSLKRPLLRDYPNLAGLFILMRAMDLLRMKGNRLVLCPAALATWRGLNATEQYFALMEALLFHADSSILGGHRSRRQEGPAFQLVSFFLATLSDRWRDFNGYETIYFLGPTGEIPPWNLFVQQQLGVIEARRRAAPDKRYHSGGRGWLIGQARLTPWGTAVAWALMDFLRREVAAAAEEEKKRGTAGSAVGPRQLELLTSTGPLDRDLPDMTDELDELDFESDEDADEPALEPQFGILRPTFQPYFPEWKTNYARPRPEARPGIYILKVSLGGWRAGSTAIWRRLAVPPGHSLDSLAGAILRAFRFDNDHLYDFSYRDSRGKNRTFNHPCSHDAPHTTEITLGETGLAVKDEMLFTYDYGDTWKFNVKLEKIDPECHVRRPKVIASAGKPPKQYPNGEW
jgi:hypothetical protein